MPSPEVMGSGTLCPGGRLAWPQCPHALQASALCLQSCRSLDLQTRAHYLVEGTDWKASLSSVCFCLSLPPSPCSLGYRPSPVCRTPSQRSGRSPCRAQETRLQRPDGRAALAVCSTEAFGSGPAFHLLLSQLDACLPHVLVVCAGARPFGGPASCALTRRRCPCTAQRSSLCSPAHRHPEMCSSKHSTMWRGSWWEAALGREGQDPECLLLANLEALGKALHRRPRFPP